MTAAGILRALLLRLAWVAIAAFVALGSAGIVGAMAHEPGTPARPELTWAGDLAAEPALDAATVRLQALSDHLDSLGTTARQALVTVVAGDLASLQELIAAGTDQMAIVDASATGLETALARVPGVGPDGELVVSAALRHRYEALVGTRGLTDGLRADWTAFTGRASDAASLTGLLVGHDPQTAAAVKEGQAGHYKQALKLLDASDATIARSRAVAARLASTTDVSTLNDWLDRNAAYDAALRNLYQSLVDAKGRVTSAVRKAFEAEKAARANLPTDTRGLVVIMAEVAQGGLNQAVISIEEARGSLAAALELQSRLKAGSGLPD